MQGRRIWAALVCLALLLTPAAAAGAEELPADVDPGAWYAGAVRTVLDAGVMQGTGAGFEPDAVVTRATVFQVLYNLAGAPQAGREAEGFPDAVGTWYEDAARWAKGTGLSLGVDGGARFGGDAPMTRAELVTALCRYAGQLAGEDTAVEADMSGYADRPTLPGWSVESFRWAVAEKLVSGKDGNRLAPLDTATRAELAAILAAYLAPPQVPDDALAGAAASVTGTGDVILDLTAQALGEAGLEPGDRVFVLPEGRRKPLDLPFCQSGEDIPAGEGAVTAEGETVRLTLRGGSFAGRYAVEAGQTVTLYLARRGGYTREQLLLTLDARRSDRREDYPSDAVFANFRAVEGGDIAPGVLFRSASPIDPAQSRSPYAAALMEDAGVRTVIDLDNCYPRAAGYESYPGSAYAALDAAGGVVYLNMKGDMTSEESRKDLKNALEFLTERPGPYLIHCADGKARTGYFIMLLEALMGAEAEEIIAEYTASYASDCRLEPGSPLWVETARLAEAQLAELVGTVELSDLSGADLREAAEGYLLDAVGLTPGQVDILRAHLSTPAEE